MSLHRTGNGDLSVGVVPERVPVSYASVPGSPFTLGPGWQRVATTSATTRALRVSPLAGAVTYDIEWTSVPAGDDMPTDAHGEPIMGGEDFLGGIPLGDVYLKSATGQIAIVRIGEYAA